MKKIGIYYGSTTGTCEDIANRIAKALGVKDVKSAAEFGPDAAEYDVLLLGTSTWGDGELQDDWYAAVETMQAMDLTDKLVAVFGCGDSATYSDTFCSGMRVLYDTAKKAGARIIGTVDTLGYAFEASEAVEKDEFVGLALDEMNEAEKTDSRIASWLETIRAEAQ